MFRKPTPEDSSVVVELSISSGLFPREAVEVPTQMMEDYFNRNIQEGHKCILQYDENENPIGVAYYVPVAATNRTWNLLMIVITKSCQGQGYGSLLVAEVEKTLIDEGQRILLVETSGISEFEQTRNFYKKIGFTEEARIRDYYEDGNDMVLFHKALPKR